MSDRFSPGEEAANLEPAARRGVRFDGSAGGRDDVLDDREAEAGATGRAGAVTPVEALEDAGQVLLGNADAVVAAHEQASIFVVADEPERGAGARIPDRVLGHVLGDNLEHALPDRKAERRRALDPKGHSRVLGTFAQLRDDLLEHRQYGQRSQRDGDPATLE